MKTNHLFRQHRGKSINIFCFRRTSLKQTTKYLNISKKWLQQGIRKITLLHVKDQARIDLNLLDKLDEFNAIDLARMEDMKSTLEKVSNIEVDIVILSGNPSTEIIKFVEEKQIKLIVIGNQIRGDMHELIHGSVSHFIKLHSPASVLLIMAQQDSI